MAFFLKHFFEKLKIKIVITMISTEKTVLSKKCTACLIGSPDFDKSFIDWVKMYQKIPIKSHFWIKLRMQVTEMRSEGSRDSIQSLHDFPIQVTAVLKFFNQFHGNRSLQNIKNIQRVSYDLITRVSFGRFGVESWEVSVLGISEVVLRKIWSNDNSPIEGSSKIWIMNNFNTT